MSIEARLPSYFSIIIINRVAQYEVYLREKYGKALKDLKLDELEYQNA